MTVAQNGPRFQKSAPGNFDRPGSAQGMGSLPSMFQPSFPVVMPHRGFPGPVQKLPTICTPCVHALSSMKHLDCERRRLTSGAFNLYDNIMAWRRMSLILKAC